MFVDHSVVLELSYADARAGLARLARAGWLADVSDRAYSEGLTGLIRVGPFRDVPGAGKLVRVLMLDLIERGGTTTLPLRWEATGVMGRLFPVLDANLTVAVIDDQTTRLGLAGAYRPPLAGLGVGLDRVLLHRVADATVRSLIGQVATVIATPVGVDAAYQVADPLPQLDPECQGLSGSDRRAARGGAIPLSALRRLHGPAAG